MNAYIVGCAKNCGKHIESVFENIEKMSSFFNKTRIVIFLAIGEDDTLDKLKNISQKYPHLSIAIIYDAEAEKLIVRTERISSGRNALLNHIRNTHNIGDEKWTYMIMLDMDNITETPMDLNAFQEVLQKEHQWDAVSFNSPEYYDIWALSYKPFTISCWNWGQNSWNVVDFMKQDIQTKLKSLTTDFFECESAFNGLAIYKLDKFLDCSYNHITPPYDKINKDDMEFSLKLFGTLFDNENISIYRREHDEDCEHRAFHIEAREKNGARICISPKILFPKMIP